MSPITSSLIVQADGTIFLEVLDPHFEELRERLMAFSEFEKSPEHVHVYRITPISLWNAAAAGLGAEDIVAFLKTRSRFPLPPNVRKEIEDSISRYGKVRLARGSDDRLLLQSDDHELIQELCTHATLEEFFSDDAADASGEDESAEGITVRPECRGRIKLMLAKLGYPVADLAGYREGARLDVGLRDRLADGSEFLLRDYQRQAVDGFWAQGTCHGGSGVIVLPCGAGKTIVGMGVLQKVARQTLILTTNITALRQWRRELIEKTDIPPDAIGEYSGAVKQIRPVTLSTYQILTHRKSKVDDFTHFRIFSENEWGLIVYDEVHLLPAPVFRFTAEIQATRRLGLTATLVREDGREAEVFSLIGPRKFDIPWRALEAEGWIAAASCYELRVSFDPSIQEKYLAANGRGKFRISSENPKKLEIVRSLVTRHSGERVLVLGQYIEQLEMLSRDQSVPLITGKTPNDTRDELYESFRRGDTPVLIVSKVGNFAVDLPEANVAIQVSGTFGSRQEEAQRLGRILRPKKDGSSAIFYSIVTQGSREQEFAERRQLFLTEQGYRYHIRSADELLAEDDGYTQIRCS